MYMQLSARCESSSSGYDDVTYVYDDVTYVYAAVGKMRKQLFGISYMDGSSGSAGGDRSQLQYKMYFKQKKIHLDRSNNNRNDDHVLFCMHLSMFKNAFCKLKKTLIGLMIRKNDDHVLFLFATISV